VGFDLTTSEVISTDCRGSENPTTIRPRTPTLPPAKIKRWFSLGTLVSFTNKTVRHDIAEALLKLSLNLIALTILAIIDIDV
jgi:hypothetical protein